MANQAAFSTTS